MDYRRLEIFNMAVEKMRYLNERQDAIAQNVANVNTPDYRPHDLPELDFRETIRQQEYRVQMQPASAGHSLAGTLPTEPRFRTPEQNRVYETKPSGNQVILEEQLVKLQETQLQYQTTTNLYKKYQQMVRTALGRRG